MSERGNNPFANYEPPEIDEIFSEDAKIEILLLKVERLAKRARGEILANGHIEELRKGSFRYELSYDCRGLEPFITFPFPEDELRFVGNAVFAGMKAAFDEALDEGTEVCVNRAYEFSDESSRIANIIIAQERHVQ